MRQQDILAERRRPPLTVRVRGGLPGRPCPGPADCIRRIKELQFSFIMAEAVLLPPCLTFCVISLRRISILCFCRLAFMPLTLYCRNIAAYHILLRVSHLFFLPPSLTPFHVSPQYLSGFCSCRPASRSAPYHPNAFSFSYCAPPIAYHSHTGQPWRFRGTIGEVRRGLPLFLHKA